MPCARRDRECEGFATEVEAYVRALGAGACGVVLESMSGECCAILRVAHWGGARLAFSVDPDLGYLATSLSPAASCHLLDWLARVNSLITYSLSPPCASVGAAISILLDGMHVGWLCHRGHAKLDDADGLGVDTDGACSDFDKAARILDNTKGLAAAGGRPAILFNLARCAARLCDAPRLLELCDELCGPELVCQLDDLEYARTLHLTAAAYLTQGDYFNASALLYDAFDAAPDDVAIRRDYGDLRHRLAACVFLPVSPWTRSASGT
jgi:hypothetical protein